MKYNEITTLTTGAEVVTYVPQLHVNAGIYNIK